MPRIPEEAKTGLTTAGGCRPHAKRKLPRGSEQESYATMIAGVSLILIAAILQGVFLLPMPRARQWAWEHVWLAFTLTGMLLGNWILALLVLPNPLAIFAGVPRREILILACFGLAWGAGAVLFGLAMDMLGLALGYPLIMGLNASIGTFVPLLWFDGLSMFEGRKLFISAGTLVAIAGIWACSVAGARRQSSAHRTDVASRSKFLSGLIMAIASGTLSCLPNIGLAYGTTTIQAARDLGASQAFAGDAVWLIFFTCGGVANIAYCGWLIGRRKTVRALFAPDRITNWWWSLAMGGMWIASFYLYGIGAARLGRSGGTIGWPILVSVSIAVGVLCGLGKGEWAGAPARARSLLWSGLALIVLAVLIIPLGKTQ
jgi:L-rhamnose-H+ transport protein